MKIKDIWPKKTRLTGSPDAEFLIVPDRFFLSHRQLPRARKTKIKRPAPVASSNSIMGNNISQHKTTKIRPSNK